MNVYRVTQHFGGLEEGGWWYDWYECIETVETPAAKAEETFRRMHKKREKEGYLVDVELLPAESESQERPVYE